MSGVGAIIGGSGGYFLGSAIEEPERRRQKEIDKKLNITIIDKDK